MVTGRIGLDARLMSKSSASKALSRAETLELEESAAAKTPSYALSLIIRSA